MLPLRLTVVAVRYQLFTVNCQLPFSPIFKLEAMPPHRLDVIVIGVNGGKAFPQTANQRIHRLIGDTCRILI